MAVECPISSGAAAFPDFIALVEGERSFSYAELEGLVGGMSKALRQLGIGPKDRIAFLGKTQWQTIVLLFALFRIGAIACPLNTRHPDPKSLVQALEAKSFLDPETLTITPSKESALLEEGQLATFLFTSGSSGSPKIACHCLGNHLYSALGAYSYLSLLPGDRWLLSLPLFHVGGLGILFRCFLARATVALSEDTPGITHLSLVATQLHRLLKKEIPKEIKCILLGGGPFAPALYFDAIEKGLNVIPTYGMTEMSSLITLGQEILPFREVQLAADGEILVRGKTLFQGYLEEGSLVLPTTSDGWFATKDLGCFLEDGTLFPTGRKDNLFISGGENIQPEEIEEALRKIPGILEAVVIPFYDEEFGERPFAFIHDETGQHTEEGLRLLLREKLPAYKVPVHIRPLPQEQGLKQSRAALRDRVLP